MVPELGVIEGYFGRPWGHEDRKHVLTVLRALGYSWFHYAPKADAFLRRRWREPHPDAADGLDIAFELVADHEAVVLARTHQDAAFRQIGGASAAFAAVMAQHDAQVTW